MHQVLQLSLIHILSRRSKNNPVLIGEPGVGKTAIAEGLAQRIVNNDAVSYTHLYRRFCRQLNIRSRAFAKNWLWQAVLHSNTRRASALNCRKWISVSYTHLTPEGVRQAYSDEEFVALTRELTEVLHRNRTSDWNRKESARAKMRVMVKRLLKKRCIRDRLLRTSS